MGNNSKWPVSAKIEQYAGGVRLTVNGRAVNPMIFYGGGGGPDYPDHEPFFDTVPMAKDSQVNLLFWENVYDNNAYNDEINDRVFGLHPDCTGIIRIGYYPKLEHDEMGVSAKDETGYVASFSSLLYRKMLKERIVAYVEWLRGKPYAAQIIGVQIMFGTSGEWFWDMNTYAIGDYSRASQDAFRGYLQLKYRDPANLNAAWGTKFAALDEAAIPAPERRFDGDDGSFRTPAMQDCIDYDDFYTTAITDLIRFSADAYKEAAGEDFLVGVLYGYDIIFGGAKATQATGAFGLWKILKYDRVNFMSSPLFYHNRRPGVSSEPMGYFHTLPLNGKMFILENDTRNYMCAAPDWPHKDDYRKYGVFGTDTLEQSKNVDIRDALTQTIIGGGMYWMDLVSRGWWKDRDLWDLNHTLLAVAASKMIGGGSLSYEVDIALVIDEKTTSRMGYNPPALFLNLYNNQPRELARTGYSYGFFHIEDLDLLPESVKTVILINPGLLNADDRHSIERLKSGNRTIIFIYAADYAGDNGNDISAAERITGIRIRKSDAPLSSECEVVAQTADTDGPVIDESMVAFPQGLTLNPAFYADDPAATTLARYKSGETAIAYRRFSGWTSVYCGVPCLSGEFIKALTRFGGTAPYCDAGYGTLKTDGRLFLYHGQGDRPMTIDLKLRGESRVIDVINRKLIGERVKEFTFDAETAGSRAFMAFRGKTSDRKLSEADLNRESEFTGSYVSIRAACGPDGGRIGVSIDGMEYPYLETYAPEETVREFPVSFNLINGKHRIRLDAWKTKHRDSAGFCAVPLGITTGSDQS
jgi:hypothetical protein